MKKIILLGIITLMLLLSSCWSKGDTEVKLSGNENLPEEIRGLRVK